MSQRRELALDRAAARTAHRVITNAQRTAAEVTAWHGVPAERVVVVRNGVVPLPTPGATRERLRRAWGVRDGGRVALFLGHDTRRKGLEVALAAFQRVAGPLDRFVAAGPHRAPSGVLALGPVPAREVLHGADAMILPSRYDASSNAVLEALAAGVPPVCSGRDGAAEVVPLGSLVVADPADVDGFARALGYAWGSSESAALRAAAQAWPVSRMVDETEAVYRELVDE